MTKWKWLLALRVPAKFFIVNENGDYFWLHRENAAVMREFVLVRRALGAGAIRTFARLLAVSLQPCSSCCSTLSWRTRRTKNCARYRYKPT